MKSVSESAGDLISNHPLLPALGKSQSVRLSIPSSPAHALARALARLFSSINNRSRMRNTTGYFNHELVDLGKFDSRMGRGYSAGVELRSTLQNGRFRTTRCDGRYSEQSDHPDSQDRFLGVAGLLTVPSSGRALAHPTCHRERTFWSKRSPCSAHGLIGETWT